MPRGFRIQMKKNERKKRAQRMPGALDARAAVDQGLRTMLGPGVSLPVELVETALTERKRAKARASVITHEHPASPVSIAGWGHCVGAQSVPAAVVEKEHGLAPDTILRRAGIESVARAGRDEGELDLAVRAAQAALARAGVTPSQVDYVIVTSETFL